MAVTLRDYQSTLDGHVAAAWNAGHKCVVMVLPTGGGKTRILAAIVERHTGSSCIIAHRSEIVAQLSCALAECGVRHNLIASKKDQTAIARLHVKKFGTSFYDPSAPCAVASVNTLKARAKQLGSWAAQVSLVVIDEGHHVVQDNTWGNALAIFPRADCRILLPTATPQRSDGKGLGSPEYGGDGFATAMVEGPTLQWLMDEGYLCRYHLICADSHMEQFLGAVGNTGDWTRAQLKEAAEQTPIVGNAVNTYQMLNAGMVKGVPAAPMRTGVLFSSDIETAEKFLRECQRRGIKAALVTGDTDPDVRRNIFMSLECRQLELVIAVDIVSEGTDIPALELGIFCRATASLSLYMQQLGRILRPLMTEQYKAARTREERLAAIAASPKPIAYIIDHVGNFLRFGPPQKPRAWSLESTRNSRGPGDGVSWRACLNVPDCGQPFERFRTECPHCGWVPPPPPPRSGPDIVEGDMVLLDPEVIMAMCGDIQAATMTVDDYRQKLAATGLPTAFIHANAKKHAQKLEVLASLKQVMETWGGARLAEGLNDREMQKLFFQRFGVDVYTAQTYGKEDALKLLDRVLLDVSVKSA